MLRARFVLRSRLRPKRSQVRRSNLSRLFCPSRVALGQVRLGLGAILVCKLRHRAQCGRVSPTRRQVSQGCLVHACHGGPPRRTWHEGYKSAWKVCKFCIDSKNLLYTEHSLETGLLTTIPPNGRNMLVLDFSEASPALVRSVSCKNLQKRND